jgi:UDP-GlcNAc:undecaprenyl-phosphate GlcNAc-1-phosphate transferase
VSSRVAYGVIVVVVALTTAIFTPIFRRIAIRYKAVVAPDERRVHTIETPLLGGAAMLVGFLVGMAVASQIEVLKGVFNGKEAAGVIVAAVLMLVIGTIDDVREVSAPAKVAGIILCGSILVFSGVALIYFRVPLQGPILLSNDWSYLLSVIWVLGMANAINLIDGLDGLAAGIVAIASGTFFLYTMLLTREGLLLDGNIAPLIAVIVLGMCVGFLPFNFHPAKIFMGDGGALMLGVLMAASTMVVGGRVPEEVKFSGQTYFFFAPMLIPLFILGVPIFDTFLAIVRRAAKRSGVASADKEHIHHRLMRLGHGQRRSVLILWGWTLLLSLLVLYPAYMNQGNGIVPIGLAALGLALFTVLHPGARESRAERRNGTPAEAGAPGEAAGARGTAGPDARAEERVEERVEAVAPDGPRVIAPGVTVSRVADAVAPDRPDGSSPVTPDEALAALDATSPRRSS